MKPLPIGYQIRHSEFKLFQSLFFQHTGIALPDYKKSLVVSRLAKRLRHFGLDSFYQYYTLLKKDKSGQGEILQFVDQLTTHETNFFREPRHFDFLKAHIKKQFNYGKPLRIWSAACSTGQEAYSIAMAVSEVINHENWHIMASDISSESLKKARSRLYTAKEASSIPVNQKLAHCLMGVGERKGLIKIKKQLLQHMQFEQVNLSKSLPVLGRFDFIFLRNVLIYFDDAMKTEILKRVIQKLNPGGSLLLGHAESLPFNDKFTVLQPTVYQYEG